MARIYPLFSSSKGNAVYVGSKTSGILIDAGVSLKRLKEALSRCEIEETAIRAVFITHDHSDHVKGLFQFTKQFKVPVYGQEITLNNIKEQITSEAFSISGSVQAAGMEITPFSTSHDTDQSCGYRIRTPDQRLCAVCTDLGIVTPEVEEHLTGCNLVLLEANYDEEMLRRGGYPAWLKSRIRSDHGHLSNTDCARQAARLLKTGTTRLILGHLSQDNNTPELAERTVVSGLSEFTRNRDYILSVAAPETAGQCVIF